MEYGFNQNKSKTNSWLRLIFVFIRTISKIYATKRHYRINSIKFKDSEYLVTYYYPGNRLTFIKSASELFKNKELIDNFNYNDAAIIGFCVSTPSQEQYGKTIKSFKKFRVL